GGKVFPSRLQVFCVSGKVFVQVLDGVSDTVENSFASLCESVEGVFAQTYQVVFGLLKLFDDPISGGTRLIKHAAQYRRRVIELSVEVYDALCIDLSDSVSDFL